MGNSQYFEVIISSPKKAVNQVSMDATKYILDGLSLEDEDGVIKTLSFSMMEGFTNLEKLSIGMVVTMRGGDLLTNTTLFTGTISSIIPDYKDNGEVFLSVVCLGSEGSSLGRSAKDVIYPSNTHSMVWGKENTTYSKIITNLAKDADFEVNNENIVVNNDRLVSHTNPIRQRNKTDWEFMQSLAKDIKCTLWTEHRAGKDQIFLKSNSVIIDKLSSTTFYYLARTNRSDFIDIPVRGKNQIQLRTVSLNLDTRKSKITQSTNPVTGKSEIVAEGESESERWVLDEAKVRALPASERKELLEMFMSGKISWEGSENGEVSAKPYFKLVTNSESSRVSKSSNIEVEVAGDKLNSDGITTSDGSKENTGSRSYTTSINKDKIAKLSSEKRASIMGRLARGEKTKEDESYYEVVDTTPKPEANVVAPISKTADALASTADTKKDKRDAGFKIEGSVFGTLGIRTKRSYVIEGLGKYSGKYYLYRIIHTWGNNGWELVLTFVK